MRKDHHIVDRGHCIAAHPFEDRLRRVEPASDLHVGNLEPFVFDERLDVCAGCRHVDRRRIGRHKNTTFLTEYKNRLRAYDTAHRRFCSIRRWFTMKHDLTLSGQLNKHLYVLCAAQTGSPLLAEEKSKTAGIQRHTDSLRCSSSRSLFSPFR